VGAALGLPLWAYWPISHETLTPKYSSSLSRWVERTENRNFDRRKESSAKGSRRGEEGAANRDSGERPAGMSRRP
jgi:hypothetical protein